ncbi:uncharacterized protein ALTATR162_LOCUS7060 [Alternaria atra]|uniref:Aminoglycoside phosphotransferase domain-containing protein n=1 Tax=Alternaria atra TaxID=119953 RepID=A0A8J2N1H6_9PLEO|nr:uncharacterized protein ALTATR162_LOCUS7060 [Alternaria atra]CAG5169644.1 unnamed protein product [Alternaria atra]
MAPTNAFTNEHVQDEQPDAESTFVVGDEEDRDDAASQEIMTISTAEQELEPYETLRLRVPQLMRDLFPGYRTEDVDIERIHDGRHNRIIGITLCKSPPKAPWYSTRGIHEMIRPCLTGRKNRTSKPKQFVLRIPRNPPQNMHHQVTTLAYLSYKLEHPVPKVTVFDAGADNALCHAYILQERLPGQLLSNLWPTLNQAQRLSATRAISNIVLDIRKIKNKCPGLISIRNSTYDLKRDLVSTETVPIPRTRPNTHPTSVDDSLSVPQSTRDFLLDLCARQRAHAGVTKLPACNDLWDKIIKAIETLHSLGLIPSSSPFHLYHGDFHLHNLLTSVTSESTVEITGIMDWDLAFFAPAFLSTRAPNFLWTSGDRRGVEDGDAMIGPQDAELLEVKRTFESVVGDSFLKEANCPGLILARRLFHILLEGFENGGDIFLAEEIVEEFERSHPLA